MEFKLKVLTDIWTGGVNIGKCSSFRTSGVIGSLRWWYELAVRALNGYACCPVEKPCPDKDGNQCAVCQLFGCTGWSRKFKLRVEYTDGTLVTKPLGKNTYIFRFIFTKRSSPKEKWLLARDLGLASACWTASSGRRMRVRFCSLIMVFSRSSPSLNRVRASAANCFINASLRFFREASSRSAVC